MAFGLRTWVGPRNHVLDGVRHPLWEGAIFWGKGAHCKYRDFLPWDMQQRLNRSISRLGCGLRWAEGSSSSIIFARWRQCALIGGHIGATWRIWLNHPSAAAMRSCQITLTICSLCNKSVQKFYSSDIDDENCPFLRWHSALATQRITWIILQYHS